MQLSDEQLRRYARDGYLLVPNCFSPREVQRMLAELPELFAEDSERRVLEKQSGAVRSVYGSHATNEVFMRLARHPRLAEPAMQILGGEVYLYQFKINAKLAFVGDVWEWHQDFIFWQREDGVREPKLVTISVFLDEVTEFNGPLMLVPASHELGVVEPTHIGAVPQGYETSPDWIANLTADIKYSIDKEALARLVARRPITAPKGPAGSVLFFDCNIAHASVPNLSPVDRRIVLVTYNRVDNAPPLRPAPRPEFLVSRDLTPVTPLADDALLT